MGWWWIAGALAGPMGPTSFDAATASWEVEPEPRQCDATYPYSLVQVPTESDLLRVFQPQRSWGTPALVRALVSAAGEVAAEHPQVDPLFIGDLSTRRGGALPPHRWHHDGRSADIGLYRGDGAQPRHGFEALWPSQLDAARTWALLEALLASGRVEHILLDDGHVRRLKQHLRAEGLLTEAQIKAVFPPKDTPNPWRRRGIVRHAPHHRDHLHVRLMCDDEPTYAWPPRG